MSDTRRAIQGVKWNYGATAVQMLAQLAFVAVVARLLDPAAFGIMAMAMVVVRFGSYLSGAGIRFYLIQKPTLTSADVQAAFALTGTIGSALCVVTFGLAPLVARSFDSAAVESVIRVLALSFLVNGFGIPAAALLQRSLRFRAVAVVETVAYVVGYLVIGLVLAVGGFGVWALVAAALSQQAIVLVLSLIASPHSIGLAFGAAECRDVAVKGSHFAFNTILDYFILAAPTVFVAKQLGAAQLGVYNRSCTLVSLPTYAISAALSRVLLPYVSPLQSDPAKLRQVFAQCATLSTLIFVPLCLGMIPAAREIVLLVLGDQWVDAVPVFQVLAFATAMQLMTVELGTYADAVRKLTARTAISLSTLATMVIAMYALIGYGLVGAAAAFAIGQATQLGLYACLLARLFHLSVKDYLAIYTPGAAVGTCVAISIAVSRALLGEAPLAVVLLSEMLLGAAMFAVAVLIYPDRRFKSALIAILIHSGFAARAPRITAALRLRVSSGAH